MPSVRSKITQTYILVSFAVILLLLLPLAYFVEAYFADRLLSELKTQTTFVATLLREHGGREENKREILSSLSSIASSAGVRITLIDSSGLILFESSVPESLWTMMENHLHRPEVIASAERGVGSNTRESGTLGTNMLYVSRSVDPLQFDDTPFRGMKFVRIGIVSAEVEKQVSDIRWMIAGVGIVAFGLIVFVSRLVAGRISRPILEIAEIVQEIKAGNLDRKLPVRGDDEIGRLAELINEMTGKLKEDISQLKRLERFRSEFLGNVSHELRTPIFSLKGFLETLSEGAIEDPSVNRSFVEKAYHHAGRLDTLLSDLIEISRIESGDMKMSFRYFDVVGFLHQIRDDFVDEASRKKQTITVQAEEMEIMAFGDKDRLRQALGSIVDNAVKYSQPQAEIGLSVGDKPNSVEIAVSDNGPGIPSEHLPRIFERFYRVDKNRSREVGGTGLGLAIAKHIVEAHGARIAIRSEVGVGTTFSFELKK
jgi:two-component system phosphate regulon sensor histidine kinase PhoR